VQLESMGHLSVRHSVDWGDVQMLESKFLPKYQKYLKMNMKDLKQVKTKALKENNFEQIENFVDYERMLDDSYLSSLLKFLLFLAEFLKAHVYAKEHSHEFFHNMTGVLVATDNDLKAQKRKQRTQDLKITKGNLEVVEEFEKFREVEESWIPDLSHNNEYLSELVARDKVLAYFKFPITSNYKENFANSLGVFEDTNLYTLLHSILTAIAKLRAPNEEQKESVVGEVRVQYEGFLKGREELAGKAKKVVQGERLDEQGYRQAIKVVQSQVELILSMLEVGEKLSFIKKVEGEPNSQLIEKIFAHKDAIILMIENLKAFVLQSQNDLKSFEDGDVERVKVKFIELWVQGTLFFLAFEYLAEKLKQVLPSKNKKKGQDENLEVL